MKEKVKKRLLFVTLFCITQWESAYCCIFVGTLQSSCTSSERGTCRHYIVHDGERLALPFRWDGNGFVDAFCVLETCFALQRRLRLAVLRALQQVHHRQPRHLCHTQCQHLSLVIAASQASPPMQRHRDKGIDAFEEAVSRCLEGSPSAELDGELAFAVELEVDDKIVIGRVVVVAQERRGAPDVGDRAVAATSLSNRQSASFARVYYK